MLMAHPAVLPGLVDRYWALSVLDAAEGDSPVGREIRAVERALCVATGTTDVHAALIAARHHLPGTGTLDDSVLAPG
ncbi:DUF5133 domain-containing protein [Streptomyces virginiae]|uniref:DUF5133 domain-containing protein n=1 Tax=Streptomyces virginiae TaxID=1961 RepID=A0ABQ3NP63_STRVG|nr:DUF5133 domain-containing protein [Streptomyces virginiae]MBP2341570.1 hypothetical protein [Streptomyces virginiae]GGQ12183.1 DUF5133 domain-containing protein [Streptomyces virginiae]GHI14561.1 DUF5133 domain-containing protein [Streptomyces virginiae]